MEEKQAFFVETTDNRKFKMVIRGDLGKLSVAKIRRYLKSYGVPENQTLLAGNLVLEDDMLGEQFGLQNEGVLYLRDAVPKREPGLVAPAAAPQGSQVQSLSSSPKTQSSSLRQPQPQPQQQQQFTFAPAEAWRDARAEPPAQDTRAMERELTRLQGQLDAAEARNEELEGKLEQATRIAAAPASQRGSGKGGRGADADGLEVAKECLALLARQLRVSLQFDRNLTCVVGTDEDFSLLLTYDPATERLYLYSSLLTELPGDPTLRMKLYEVLLEGSLLGREVCGGGVGVSTQNNVVVLTTSLPVRYCEPQALCEVMPAFVETLGRWRSLVDELLS